MNDNDQPSNLSIQDALIRAKNEPGKAITIGESDDKPVTSLDRPQPEWKPRNRRERRLIESLKRNAGHNHKKTVNYNVHTNMPQPSPQENVNDKIVDVNKKLFDPNDAETVEATHESGIVNSGLPTV